MKTDIVKYANGDMAGEPIEVGHFVVATQHPETVLGQVSLVLEPESPHYEPGLIVEFDPCARKIAAEVGFIDCSTRTDEDTGIEIPAVVVHPADISYFEWQTHDAAYTLHKAGERIVDCGYYRRPGTVRKLHGWASSMYWGHMSRLYEVAWDDGVTELVDVVQFAPLPADWHPNYPIPSNAVLWEPDVSKWGKIGPTREGAQLIT